MANETKHWHCMLCGDVGPGEKPLGHTQRCIDRYWEDPAFRARSPLRQYGLRRQAIDTMREVRDINWRPTNVQTEDE